MPMPESPRSAFAPPALAQPSARRQLLRWCVAAGAAPLAGGLAGCGALGWRPTPAPIATLTDRLADGRRPETLVVFLPGTWDAPGDFVKEGFVAELRRRALPVDAVMVDAHVAYYRSRTVVDRLRDDVIVPARLAGYRSIWLVGISLGGLGAFLYAAESTGLDRVDGIVSLAPFVGSREVLDEVRAAGGLRRWTPPPVPAPAPDDWERRLLGWLRGYYVPPAERAPVRPQLLVGWGTTDRFAESLELVFADQPAGERMTVAGGHDWTAWRALWRGLLDRHGSSIGGRVLA